MGDKNETAISWTHMEGRRGVTWNPVRGCSRVSPGCGGGTPGGGGGCYAEGIAARFSGPGQAFEGFAEMTAAGPRWTGKVALLPKKLAEPLSWREPRCCFVNSMSDLFHESLAFEEIAAVVGIIAACPQHVFQSLTKRAARMREWFEWIEGRPFVPGDAVDNVLAYAGEAFQEAGLDRPMASIDREARARAEQSGRWPLPQWWLGVSAEDQKRWDERVPELLRCPAAVRFVSCEPLLSRIDLLASPRDGKGQRPASARNREDLRDHTKRGIGHRDREILEPSRRYAPVPSRAGPSPGFLAGIHQVIVGAESGPGARPMETEWAASIRDQCKESGTAFYMKQFAARGKKITDPRYWPPGDWPQEFPDV